MDLCTPAAARSGDLSDSGDAALRADVHAIRSLLWADDPADVAAVLRRFVADLGGTVVAARSAPPDALPVDVSMGVGEPLLPVAPAHSRARWLLERHLPALVRDAHRAVELGERSSRLAEDAAVDSLTGLSNRRMLGRILGRLGPEQTVVMIDLDHFKAVNDTLGHAEGDRVLRTLGRTLSACVRASDRAGRYGGEEFVVVLDGQEPEPFLVRLREAWAAARPHPVTFSAGVAPAAPDPRRALEAADRALYRAKTAGRNQWKWAESDDYDS